MPRLRQKKPLAVRPCPVTPEIRIARQTLSLDDPWHRQPWHGMPIVALSVLGHAFAPLVMYVSRNRPGRMALTLFPPPQGAQRHPEQGGKLGWRQTRLLTRGDDRRVRHGPLAGLHLADGFEEIFAQLAPIPQGVQPGVSEWLRGRWPVGSPGVGLRKDCPVRIWQTAPAGSARRPQVGCRACARNLDGNCRSIDATRLTALRDGR